MADRSTSTPLYRSPFPRIASPPTPSPLPKSQPSAMSLNNFLRGRNRRSQTDEYSDAGSETKSDIFNSAQALSFSDAESSLPKLPVPVVGAARNNVPNTKLQHERSNSRSSDIVPLDVKPPIFEDASEEEEDYFDDDSEIAAIYDDPSYYGGDSGMYEPSSEKCEDEDDTVQPGNATGALWQNETTINSSLFDESVQEHRTVLPYRGSREAIRPTEPSRFAPRPINIANPPVNPIYTRTEPPPSNQNYGRTEAPPSNQNYSRAEPPLSNQNYNRPSPEQSRFPLRKDVAPLPGNKQIRLPSIKPTPPPEDPDRTIRVNTPLSPPYAAPTPSPSAATPYLSDDELRSIPSLDALLSQLGEAYASSRSSPSDLDHELKTLLQYDYPTKSLERPTRFFEALPDEAYEKAGEIIRDRMEEIQDRIKETAKKRHKVSEGHMEKVVPVAQERADKLKILLERGELLKGGVGKLLMENGFLNTKS
ncbi:hypothetical protein BZA77DRAFT_325355 [Pyronema omphalodes]|nr:hypothetical protein BZA77DRAFT_325355 [Pyronema omphalodes]